MERKRTHSVRSTRLLVDNNGMPIGRDALRYRFDQARLAAGIVKADF
ncbi:hypothetical protein [Xanthomonas cannabis]|nr:hypothetical protein [Xanthomonas cannabis]MCC8442136.1 hypothetical protein [Xanthomonas cannabis]